MSKELESLIPDNPFECLKVLRTSANSYCSFNNDQCEYNKKLADNIEQALIKANQYLGARRNDKTLEQMYQLVQYSKKPMKPSIWIARIDGKLEQRVVMEKEDYDKLQIKSQEQEKELNKYKQLKEQIGCPLEVFLELATHKITEIYIEYDHFSGNYASPYCSDEDIIAAYVAGIYDSNEIDGLSKPEWKIETNMGTFPLSDYKEHFWLKKDKSE